MNLRSLVLLALLGCGCAAPGATRLQLDRPTGSKLIFVDGQGTKTAFVEFPGDARFVQFSSEGDPSERGVSGTLVVSQLVEEQAVPASARGHLVDSAAGVVVPVEGTYEVHALDLPEGQEATVELGLTREQLVLLLEGEELVLRAGEPRAVTLRLRLAPR